MVGFDFDNALKSGYQKGEIVDFLRKETKSNIDWEGINQSFQQAKANNPDLEETSFTFDYLKNNQDSLNFEKQQATKEDTLERIKEKEKTYQKPSFLEQVGESLPFIDYKSEATKHNEDVAQEIFQTALNSGIQAKGLDSKTNYLIAKDRGLFDDFFLNQTKSAQKALDSQRMRQNILQKEYAEDLSKEEREFLKEDVNKAGYYFDKLTGKSDEEIFEEYKNDQIAKNFIAPKVQEDINRLNAYHKHKSIRNIWEQDEQARENYLESVNAIVGEFGFSGSGFDQKGNLVLFKDGEAYKVNEDFFENFTTTLSAIKGEVAGGISGAVYGARVGSRGGVLGALAGAGIGGALGSAAGASLDVVMNNAILDRENTANEIIGHSLEAGAMSLAGDVGALAISKLAKPTLKLAGNLTSKAADNVIVGGFIRNIPNQNLRGANKILENSYTKGQREELLKFGEEFGGMLKSGDSTNLQKFKESIAQSENMPFKDTALKIANALDKPTLKDKQLEIIDLIRADSSGNTLAFLIEAANTSPQIQKNLREILNRTTYNLQNELEKLGMQKQDIRGVFETLKEETKENYNEAINEVLGKLYDENYKVVLGKEGANYQNFRKELEEQGLITQESMPFLNYVERTIYNPNGVTFTQLNNALKNLNSYYKSAKDPNFKDHIKGAIEGFLREEIKGGIDLIFSQNKTAYAKARELYENALSDYAVMKEVFKLKGIKDLVDSNKTKEAAEDSLLKFLEGQGEINRSNYEAITQNLNAEQIKQIEMGVLNAVFQKSLVQEDSLKVFNPLEFNKNIERIKPHFKSAESKEALDLISGFSKLFINDGQIAYALRSPNTQKEGYGLAASIGGAVNQKTTKLMFENILRLLPDIGIPLTPIKFNAFNEKIQGAALRYHIRNALKNSLDIEDFKTKIQARNTPKNFNLPTRQVLNEFLGQVDEIKEATIKDLENGARKEAEFRERAENKKGLLRGTPQANLEESVTKGSFNNAENRLEAVELGNPLPEFGTNYPEFYHNGKGAINKLLETRSGQVAGAFEKEGLGDIDLVWGEVTDSVNHKGFGLSHIIDKHPDFDVHLIPEIIKKGEVLKRKGRDESYNIEYNGYKIGINKGFNKEGENKWIVTAFNDNVEISAKTARADTSTKEADNLSLNSGVDSSINAKNSQLKELGNSQTFHDESFTSKSDSERKGTDILLPNQQNNSTTNPSLFANAMEQKTKELESKLQREAKQAEAMERKKEAIAKQREEILKDKEESAGQSVIKRTITLGQEIPIKEVKAPLSRILINEEPMEFKYIVANKEDIQTNFNGNALQPRTEKNENVIQRIATQYKPNLMIGRGGFEDLPIITKDGQVIAGNHRLEGMKNFNESSRARYQKAIKESFGVDLKENELLLRMPNGELANDKLVSLAFVSNKETTSTYGDKALASLGKYANALEAMPKYLESTDVENLGKVVANALQKDRILKDTEEANLALLSHLAKNSNGENIASVLTRIHRQMDAEGFAKLKDMFAKNAGLFHNLVNDSALQNLELRSYLLEAIENVAKSLKTSRAENFKALGEKIDNTLKTTDANGANALIEANPEHYKEILGEVLGASLAKFARQENPSGALYEVLKNAKEELKQRLEPTLLSEGKPLSQADVYDFLELLISKGETTEATSKVIDLLPALREKEGAFNAKRSSGDLIKTQTKEQENGNIAIDSDNINSDSGGATTMLDNRQNILNEQSQEPQDSAVKENLTTQSKQLGNPLPEFGTNYPEFYHNGKGAINKLLETRSGQVAGAFEKEGLGDIDLVWGEVTDSKNHKGFGLAHIIDKHPDFDVHKIPEIIKKGELINQNNIRYRIQKDNYVIGLSAEYKGEKRNFIITAFERNKDKGDTFTERPFTQTSDNAVKNLDGENSTTDSLKLQSNAHIGSGLVGGSVAGVETDENGNITGFNAEKFALGFLGGAGGSKGVQKALEYKAKKISSLYPNITKDNPALANEIIKRTIAHDMAKDTHNMLTRFFNKYKQFDINPQIFAGEKALLSGDYEPQKAKLAKAKELQEAGKSEVEIWERTGWYLDKDNKWKFEINPSGGAYRGFNQAEYEKQWGQYRQRVESFLAKNPHIRRQMEAKDYTL